MLERERDEMFRKRKREKGDKNILEAEKDNNLDGYSSDTTHLGSKDGEKIPTRTITP